MTDTGHIYKIICLIDPTFCYIGSTFDRLSKRFEKHRGHFNTWLKNDRKKGCSCYKYYEKYGIENFKIVLIKSYVVCRTHIKDRKHLNAYETLWINRHKGKCCNEVIPFNFLKKEYHKEYYENNKEKHAEQMKNWREKNREQMKEKRQNNKEQIAKRNKRNYEKNKEKLTEKVECECGCIVARSSLSAHKKRQIHKDRMAQK